MYLLASLLTVTKVGIVDGVLTFISDLDCIVVLSVLLFYRGFKQSHFYFTHMLHDAMAVDHLTPLTQKWLHVSWKTFNYA